VSGGAALIADARSEPPLGGMLGGDATGLDAKGAEWPWGVAEDGDALVVALLRDPSAGSSLNAQPLGSQSAASTASALPAGGRAFVGAVSEGSGGRGGKGGSGGSSGGTSRAGNGACDEGSSGTPTNQEYVICHDFAFPGLTGAPPRIRLPAGRGHSRINPPPAVVSSSTIPDDLVKETSAELHHPHRNDSFRNRLPEFVVL